MICSDEPNILSTKEMMIREKLKVSLPPNSDMTAEMDDNNNNNNDNK